MFGSSRSRKRLVNHSPGLKLIDIIATFFIIPQRKIKIFSRCLCAGGVVVLISTERKSPLLLLLLFSFSQEAKGGREGEKHNSQWTRKLFIKVLVVLYYYLKVTLEKK